ncbi:MAG: xanthine dehydrogenase family protein subunit M [candidate division Zixibacteria bacterium]|nr:xanthine dehydrogenase family protein subunit M [candidate division Zixibacteria bacterium]
MISITSYDRPETLEKALELLTSQEFRILAGGTDIIPQLRRGGSGKLLDIKRLGLDYIKSEGDYIEIGAAATHTDLTSNEIIEENLPILATAAGLVGSTQIRNRGTVGGNITNASPCADTAPALLIYDAELLLKSISGDRQVKLSDYIIEPYTTCKRPDELLHSIKCRKAESESGSSYIKLGRRQAVNISRMTLAATIRRDENDTIQAARISGGSVFPTPSRMPDVENMLIGEKVSSKLFEDAGKFAAELMIKVSGYRWSSPYKEPVLSGLLERALIRASAGGTK